MPLVQTADDYASPFSHWTGVRLRPTETRGYGLHFDDNSQAARFADPLHRCLANSAGENDDSDVPPAARLGLFTCIADTQFFLRAVGEALRFPSVTVVDVGDPPSHFGYEMAGAGTGLAFGGRDSETYAPEMGPQVLRCSREAWRAV